MASKTFTESVILGEMVVQLARSAGARAEHRSGFGGTRLLWNALTSGTIDIYPEYTGTLAAEIFADEARRRGQGQEQEQENERPVTTGWLRQALAARGIGMIGPLGFNNTYAIGVTSDSARRLGLAKISDLRHHPDLRLGFSSEFVSRHDGWPALRARYGLPHTDVRGLDHDLAYRALDVGSLDATDLYATDAEIRKYRLRVLEDDLGVFPRYDAVLLYRLDSGAQISAGDAALAAIHRLEGRIDAVTMTRLNARVKLDRVGDAAVAATFLRTTFGVAGDERPPGVARAILDRTVEHLVLVGLSLLAAIVLAVPLGILAASRPRVGQLMIGAVGIIQTIPSLALLVFMIPLFGIGGLPAIIALFLYSLLPIVRNTHAGVRNIPPSVVESAAGLGLPPGSILRLVQLPLASPLILAGIKSAAVINVGTATLGALVGAGGLGQPIFTGIRLDDVGLILQGAVPASLLALGAQGLFEIVERLVVPRGLRVRPPT